LVAASRTTTRDVVADIQRGPGRLRRSAPYVGLIALGLLIGVGLLVSTEMAVRLLGKDACSMRDPFAGFSKVVRMFQPTTRDGVRLYQLSPGRILAATGKTNAGPQREFLAEKSPGTFRIFTVGDSSAAGVPYGAHPTGYAFTFWLARRLEAALPEVRFEIVNAAMPGYATRRLVTVVDEVVGYRPDLVIIYAGHNEYAERRYYQHLLDMDPRLFRAREWLARSQLGCVVFSLLDRASHHDGDVPRFDMERLNDSHEMFAVLDARAGGHGYATDREREYGAMMYRTNLEEMVAAIHRAGAQAMLVTLAQNFANWPPAASAHRNGLSEGELETWRRYAREGNARADADDCSSALASYDRALAIDDQYGELVYRQAACEEALGRFDAARRDYRRASDLDQVPHGAPTSFNDILRDVARRSGALLVDADGALTEASPHGLVGDNFFTDPLHPTIRAHQIIAAAVAAEMQRANIPAPSHKWRAGYVDPDADRIVAEDPALRVGELLSRFFGCALAHRASCALAALDALTVLQPENAQWTQMRADLLKNAEQWQTPEL
jgi:lysophospholipase L1-like esterase